MGIVELNGLDGSGKTTQARLFEMGGAAQRVPRSPDAFPDLPQQELAEWWFGNADIAEIARCFAKDSHYAQEYIRKHLSQEQLAVLDRGPVMQLGALTATQMTREDVTFEEAMAMTLPIFRNELEGDPFRFSNADLALWLRPSASYGSSMPRFASAEADDNVGDKLYAKYQSNLRHSCRSLMANVAISHAVAVSAPQLETHNTLRAVVQDRIGINLDPLARNLQAIVGFSGMSESGKSSHAEYLRTNHNFYRLKLSFFANLLRQTGFEGPSRSADDDAFVMLQFIDSHHFAERFSVESIRTQEFAMAMKRMFGKKCLIVYCDANEEERRARHIAECGGASAESFARKDATKCTAGALAVKSVADYVLCTSGLSPDETHQALNDVIFEETR